MSRDTKGIIGTVVTMTGVVVSVLIFGIGSVSNSLARIDERIDTVTTRIDGVDERIGVVEADVGAIKENLRAIDDKFGTLNTTLLFLTTCIVDLEGPLPVVATTAAALMPGDPDRPSAPLMPPQVTLDLPESCRTAH